MNAPSSASPTPSPDRRRLGPWPWVAGIAITCGLGLAVASQIDATLPGGTTVAGVDLGGLTLDAARSKLAAEARAPLVTVRAGSKSWAVDATRLGWKVDAAATVSRLFPNGPTVLASTIGSIGGEAVPENPLVARVDPAAARRTLESLTRDTVTAPKNASIVFEKTRYVVRPDVPGLKPDTTAAVNALVADPNREELEVAFVKANASVSAASLQPLLAQGNALLRPITLRLEGGDRAITLTPLQVADLFWLRPTGVELDARTIATAVDRASREAGLRMKNARYELKGNKLVKAKGVPGLAADRDGAIKALGEALLDPTVKVVVLPSEVAEPELGVEDLPNVGALQLVASGRSTYRGSNASRSRNVAIAAAKLDGTIIPAGEEFSFLNTIGRITADNGFVGGLIISGGKTVEGLGGGVCQVSTTAFRALYAAGLPVVERHQHSYRVHWYDPQVGFEAAVYDPGLDLRLLNDTGGPLLIRTVNDPARGTLEVQLFGVPMKRSVAVSPATYVTASNVFITRTIKDETGVRSDRIASNYGPVQ